MNTKTFDFAVIGANLCSQLLALALSERYGKKVCLVRAPSSAFQVPDEISLSVSALTRLDHLALLARQQSDTTELLGKQGRDVLFHLPVSFVTGSSAVAGALQQARQTLNGFGFSTAPLTGDEGESIGFRALDAMSFNTQRLSALLETRFASAQIELVTANWQKLSLSNASILVDGRTEIAATQIVIPDQHAISHFVPAEQLTHDFTRAEEAHLITLPGAHMRWPGIVDLAHGARAVLLPNGRLSVSLRGDLNSALEWTSRMLLSPVGTAGRFVEQRLFSTDGGAIISPLVEAGPIIAHFDDESAPFLATSLARLFVGEADALETRFYMQSRVAASGTRHATDLAVLRGAA